MLRPIDISTLGGRIRAARLAAGLDHAKLQRAIGSKGGTANRWESGERVPGVHYVMGIAKILDVSERWIATGEGPIPERVAAFLARVSTVSAPIRPGVPALETILDDYDWPSSVSVATVDRVVQVCRDESETPAGRRRPVSVWRHRIAELLREMTSD